MVLARWMTALAPLASPEIKLEPGRVQTKSSVKIALSKSQSRSEER